MENENATKMAERKQQAWTIDPLERPLHIQLTSPVSDANLDKVAQITLLKRAVFLAAIAQMFVNAATITNNFIHRPARDSALPFNLSQLVLYWVEFLVLYLWGGVFVFVACVASYKKMPSSVTLCAQTILWFSHAQTPGGNQVYMCVCVCMCI